MRLWGSGKAKREFLYVDDMALACIFVLNLADKQYDTARMLSSADKDSEAIAHPTVSHINIGSGRDLEIKRLAETVKTAIGYEGEVVWDPSKPNGMPRKLLDVSRLNRLGWKSKIDLQDGIRRSRWRGGDRQLLFPPERVGLENHLLDIPIDVVSIRMHLLKEIGDKGGSNHQLEDMECFRNSRLRLILSQIQ